MPGRKDPRAKFHSFSRRRFFAVTPLLLGSGIAGCTTSSTGRDSGQTESSSYRETKTTGSASITPLEDSDTLTIKNIRVRSSILAPDLSTHHWYNYAEAHDGKQWLVFDIENKAKTPQMPPSDQEMPKILLYLDGARQSKLPLQRVTPIIYPEGTLAISVPAKQFSSGYLEWKYDDAQSYQKNIPDGVVADLAATPDFNITDFVLNSEGERVVGEFEVTNKGDRRGVFVAISYFEDFHEGGRQSREFHTALPIGESERETVAELNAWKDSHTVILDWGEDRITRSIALS
jgi:hypothetical protein